MQPERLSGLDASFLYLERPAMHMHVAGVSVLEPRRDGPLTYDDVQRVVEARLHLAPRLRQRVQDVPGNISRPLWVDDERFDLDFHLRRSAVPTPGERFQLERAVGRVLSRPLDRAKPLWELYVFEGLAGGRTAVLLKLHHARRTKNGGSRRISRSCRSSALASSSSVGACDGSTSNAASDRMRTMSAKCSTSSVPLGPYSANLPGGSGTAVERPRGRRQADGEGGRVRASSERGVL